jgi:hypothetical protein
MYIQQPQQVYVQNQPQQVGVINYPQQPMPAPVPAAAPNPVPAPTPVPQIPTAYWDLSGSRPFRIACTIKTDRDSGTIVGKAFDNGLWRDGGGAGQGKMLFLRGGRVCFDIGWVGCVEGRTPINDNQPHLVQLAFLQGKYWIVIDGKPDGDGLHPVPDNPETRVYSRIPIGHEVRDGVANGDLQLWFMHSFFTHTH